MNVMNMKITAKLSISSAAFLLPLGIMLFSIISGSLTGIQKARNELKGIETLRPAISLMQIVPLYMRYSADGVEGNREHAQQYTETLLEELRDNYYKNFSKEVIVVSPQTLFDNWDHVANTRIRDTVRWASTQLIGDLCKLTAYIGDISGLVTDSELECAYLVAAAVNELPMAQERIAAIINLLRTVEDGAFTQRRRAELELDLVLLIHSDNTRIQNRYNRTETLRINNTEVSGMFEILMKACLERIAYFSDAVDNVINLSAMDSQAFAMLSEAAGQANNAAYQLQFASLDRLEALISSRIKTHQLHLTLSLAAAVITTALAFTIIFLTTLNIRKSTNIMGDVFKRLHDNDLTVQVQALSQDELGEFMTAMGVFLEKLKTVFSSFSRNSSMVSTAVVELSSSAKEITTTANEQSSSVAEIVSTMENNKNLAAQAATKTVEVAELAARTQELSQRGAELRNADEDMMLDVRNQNAIIIEEIKNLADILSRIDESAQIIDTIADHTKLIAFNAALEASSSGEAGIRFAVVASEIRRFADNVVESSAEIKERITELQSSFQKLITEANTGSMVIDEGYNRMVEQKEVFENIVDASQNVAIHSQQISNLSKQQELASAQIFTALKEISSGVNQFVTATGTTSDAVDKLNSMLMELNDALSKYQINNGGQV